MPLFLHPQGLYAFVHPSDWIRRPPVTPGASFAATVGDGGLLFEAFHLVAPSADDAASRVIDATLASLRDSHEGATVDLREPFPCGHPCERVRVTYAEKVRGRFLPVSTTTDLFVLADGRNVLGLFFKVLSDRHASSVASFEGVVRSAEIRAPAPD